MQKLISIPEPVLRRLKSYAEEFYGGNFSRFICDTGLDYGKNLDKYNSGQGMR